MLLSFGSEKNKSLSQLEPFSPVLVPQIQCTSCFSLVLSLKASSLPVLGKFSTNFNTDCVCKASTTESSCCDWPALNYSFLKSPLQSLCTWKSCSYLMDDVSFRAGSLYAVGPFRVLVLFCTVAVVMEITTLAEIKEKPGQLPKQISSV